MYTLKCNWVILNGIRGTRKNVVCKITAWPAMGAVRESNFGKAILDGFNCPGVESEKKVKLHLIFVNVLAKRILPLNCMEGKYNYPLQFFLTNMSFEFT